MTAPTVAPVASEEVEVMIKKLVSEQDDVSYREVAALLRKQAEEITFKATLVHELLPYQERAVKAEAQIDALAARIEPTEPSDGLLRAAEICMTHMRLMEPDERKERDALGHLRQDLLKEAAAVQPTGPRWTQEQVDNIKRTAEEWMGKLDAKPLLPVQPTEPPSLKQKLDSLVKKRDHAADVLNKPALALSYQAEIDSLLAAHEALDYARRLDQVAAQQPAIGSLLRESAAMLRRLDAPVQPTEPR